MARKTTSPSLETSHVTQEAKILELEQLEQTLPREKGLLVPFVYFHHNFWCPGPLLLGVSAFVNHFRSQDTDILIATKPKSGTTWLKGITFAILNRKSCPTTSKAHPLLTSNSHDLVPFLEDVYAKSKTNDPPSLSKLCPTPRLVSTHMPYNSLPESIKSSGCRIVYMCRNPFDTIVSLSKFTSRQEEDEGSKLEEVVDCVCRGVEAFGPHWDHVLGYWKESLERSTKVLFMKYEDMKYNEISEIKRLAEFIGYPFTEEEEQSGVVEQVSKLCSFRNLKDLEVNKSGDVKGNNVVVEAKKLYRKGLVGDWVNHFTPTMVERVDKLMQEKFRNSGLNFTTTSPLVGLNKPVKDQA